MGYLELIALGMTCGTTIVCFMIRSGHGHSVYTLQKEVEDLEDSCEARGHALQDLQEQVRNCRIVLDNHAGNLAAHDEALKKHGAALTSKAFR